MGRFWSRRRGRRAEEHAPAGDHRAGDVDLGGDDHSWWTQGEVTQAWRPKRRRGADAEGPPPRDILAEHFGEDWRTSFGFTPPTEEQRAAEAAREQQAIDDEDPYKVLDVEPGSAWEEIVAAHRHQARVHHPDRLFGQSEEEKAEGEERIRVINAAFQELRVRRGR